VSKRFKGKTCAYCAVPSSSTTGDHVFARAFFLPEKRAALPQVPACEHCNGEKAELEHYLATVLPFGGRHSDARPMLSQKVPPRLAKNLALHRQLEEKADQIWSRETGLLSPAMTVPFEPEKLEALFRFVARGLVTHHWGVEVPRDYFVGATMLSSVGLEYFGHVLAMNCRARVQVSLGDSTFDYHGIQATDNPCLSFWVFRIFGGATFTGDPRAPSETSAIVGAATSRRPLPELFGN
jgi:hypothetical protein